MRWIPLIPVHVLNTHNTFISHIENFLESSKAKVFLKKATKTKDQRGIRAEAKATTIEANLDKVRAQFSSLIIPDRSSVAGSQSPIQ